MKWILSFLPLLLHCTTIETPSQIDEEALFVRRIADFWQEGEYTIVKNQIEEFLVQFSVSPFTQTLRATLGDLNVREKNYSAALEQYSHITDPELKNRVFLNRMECLLELQWYATLADECEAELLQKSLPEDRRQNTIRFLAIALYQQCLNATNEPETLQTIAKRVQPYFDLLLHDEDMAQAAAHLSCLSQDYPVAAQIYLTLSDQKDTNREEMLFQAALIQSKFDKFLARQTFHTVAQAKKSRCHEAQYNELILTYDTGQYEELLQKKDAWLANLSPEDQGTAHLFLGKSCLRLNKRLEAIKELLTYVRCASPEDEMMRPALIDLLEAGYQENNLPAVEESFQLLSTHFPADPDLPKAWLALCSLLKNNEQISLCQKELSSLLDRFPDHEAVESALFIQLQLDYREKRWPECHARGCEYLKQYPSNIYTHLVLQYLAAASTELAIQSSDPSIKDRQIQEISLVLQQPLSVSEKNEWSLILAQTYFDLGRFLEAKNSLEPIATSESGPIQANAALLLALCYRDGWNDMTQFCNWAERALLAHPSLMNEADIHLALFNAIIAQKSPTFDIAADHLYHALFSIEIERDNLIWLSHFYFEKSQQDDPFHEFAKRAVLVLNQLFTKANINPALVNEEAALEWESLLVCFAKLSGMIGENKQQLLILHSLEKYQGAHPEWPWHETQNVSFFIAEHFALSQEPQKALELLEQILVNNSSFKSFVMAKAGLLSARLQIDAWKAHPTPIEDPKTMKIVTLLKSISIQKTLTNEPAHLEAAIEYVDFLSQFESEEQRYKKEAALLEKIRYDFDLSNDLLTKDYQTSRKRLPEKDKIYQSYMNFIDARIAFLQAKIDPSAEKKQYAHQKLEQLVSEFSSAFIAEQARVKLEQLEE